MFSAHCSSHEIVEKMLFTLMFSVHKYLVDFQIHIVPCFPPAVLKSKFLRTCLTSLVLSQIKHIYYSKTGFSCVL